MDKLLYWLNYELWGMPLKQYLIAFGIFLLALVFKKVLAHLLTRFIQPLVNRTRTDVDDMLLNCLRRPLEMLVLVAGLFVALQVIQLPIEPVNLKLFSYALLKILVTFSIAWMLFNMVSILELAIGGWARRTGSPLDERLLPFIRKTIRVFIVVISVVMVAQNLGYSISGLLASLGIGGLAIALAAKDALANIFGSVMILMDRPFRVGDWIKAGDMEGTVEEIGFRSTKIRTFAKTMITVPNNIIANTPLNNFSRMPKRRIKMSIGVTYDSTPEQMRKAVSRIRAMLGEHPAINQDFMLVNFTDFAASSLDILVYCFTTTTAWGEYLEAREDVCLKIMDILEELGMEMAFPSQSLYLHNTEEKEELPVEVSAS